MFPIIVKIEMPKANYVVSFLQPIAGDKNE